MYLSDMCKDFDFKTRITETGLQSLIERSGNGKSEAADNLVLKMLNEISRVLN